MVIARSAMKVEQREKPRNGEGTVTFIHCIEGQAVQENTKMLAELVLPPGAGIGYHAHNEETEFYIILEGNGLVNDNGKDVLVKPGDTVVTGNGASHSLANNGNVPLRVLAVIIKG